MSKEKNATTVMYDKPFKYREIDEKLTALINRLEKPAPNGNLYVPMPSTVFLLRRLNAICAKNMRATHWFVADEPDQPTDGVTRL